MRIIISLDTKEMPLVLPIHYNELLQGAIYASLDEEIGDFMHDKGFVHQKRSFKLFTFSRLMGNYRLDSQSGKISFTDSIKIVISSPIKAFCSSILTHMIRDGRLRLGARLVDVEGVEVIEPTVHQERIRVHTLSPIVVYSTMYRTDGRKYTCYFQPGEAEFAELISGNLRKKYELVHRSDAPAEAFNIRPIGQSRMNLISYHGTIVKGYSCRLEISGPQPLLQVAMDAGLGSKNSQGFGCIELY
ncbi:MAG TPA: CRISPR-associated endoribonuclease Cas6 [Firmicutes bacterium]|nr:CRISPR-associated endoribonuclease Cas6 [Bacillota bacterium]